MPPPRRKLPSRVLYLRLNPRIVEAIHEAAEARGWTLNRWCETALEAALRSQGHIEEDPLLPELDADFLFTPGPKPPRART